MDTRSTKFKYSLFTKGLCILLAAVMFFGFSLLAIRSVVAMETFGFEEYLGGKYPSFTQSYGFRSQFSEDYYHVRNLLMNNTDEITKAYEDNKERIIKEALDSYLDRKAKIIENELNYAVENYDESYFSYEYTADSVDIPDDPVVEEVTDINASMQKEEPATDENGDEIPRNIEAAQKILKTAKGRDFLKYASLVRDSAFNESEFHYDTVIEITGYNSAPIALSTTDYFEDELSVKKLFLETYNNNQNNTIAETESIIESSDLNLSRRTTFFYYAVDKNGKIYTNADKKPTMAEIRNNSAYITYDGKNILLGNLEKDQKEYISETLKTAIFKELYIYVDDSLLNTSDDAYAQRFIIYNNLRETDAKTTIAVMFLLLVGAAILLFVLMCLCGHKNGILMPVTAFIDKLPTDLHFILSFGCIAGLSVLALYLVIEFFEGAAYTNLMLIYLPGIISAMLTVSFLLFAEWLASVARIKKAGLKFFANMLFTKFIFAFGRIIRKFFRMTVSLFRKISVTLRYKPKKMHRSIILIICGYVLGNIAIIGISTFLAMMVYGEGAMLFCIAGILIFNVAALVLILKYFRQLDMIIDASCRHESADFRGEKLPESLRILASNLTDTNAALQQAVIKAVRDEQMKTELITNVSHDLKTPLTSLISYSDLLDKCDIEDETARKYIGVINAQSIKLKRLIEDLIEASKVSSGNVTINATHLNLSELAIQAIAEFAPEMEKNGNEIIFTEPDTPPAIFADGSKTYRIISNLLSNTKKYSAPDTRVYVSVYTDKENSYFEIKNISSEPLNISAEELTERFVRGDKSRTKEGNGLGLSIAKDLCTLQSGNLNISIDGDLFKVIIQLPCKENNS